jgi:RNA polymerase sigma factor (sigma-70 family)
MVKGQQGAVLRHVHTIFNVGTIGDLPDGQLLEQFTAGSGEEAELAFAALVERHGPMVSRTCRAILHDSHDVDDAFQATFVVLLRRAGSLWVKESLAAWIHQVAYRTAFCARSAAARRRRHEQSAAGLATAPVRPEVWDDLAVVIHEEVSRLPQRYRDAVVLCLVEGLTHDGAARRLGWPVGTVESRLARGRAYLRARLARRGLNPTVGAIGAILCAERASAAVPTGLAEATIRAASRLMTAKTVAEVVSAGVLTLAEGVLRTMFITKLKMVGMALLLVGFAATGAGVWGSQKAPSGEKSKPPAMQLADKSPAVVALVWGTPITRDELIERCLAKYGAKELDSLINEAILRTVSERHGVKVTSDEVESEAERIARSSGLSVADLYRILEEKRGLAKDQYLRDVIYPGLVLRKLGEVSGGGIAFDELKGREHVEVYFNQGHDRRDEKTENRVRSREESLREVERQLEQTLKALKGLKIDGSR